MTKRKRPMNHYLVTLPLSSGVHMHCYLMCKEGYDRASAAAEKMWEMAEEMGLKPWPGIVLSTQLSVDGVTDERSVALVREFISGNEEVKRALKTAKDFHCTVWCMNADDDESLMDLH
jgi:hypothetical protein